MKKIQSFFLSAAVAAVASGIACADNVFVVNNGGNSISEISGGVLSPTPFIATDLNSPTGLAINSAGDFFVSNNGTNGAGYIAEFSSTGTFIGNYSTGENGPRGLAFDTAGNLYVSNQTAGTILEIPTGGGTGSVIASGLNFPNGVAFDTNASNPNFGTLYATEGQGGTLDIISGGVGTPLVTGLNSPNGLAFDSAGNIFVVQHGSSTVSEFSSTGATITNPFITETPAQGPKTIAVDSAGDFYITDNTDNTVSEYAPNGTLITVFSGGLNGPCFVATEITAVPEPSTYALLLAGLGMLFFMGRRKVALV